MSQASTEMLENFVYRRVAPPHFKVKKNLVAPKAFLIDVSKRGLSVFRADIATPYDVLQACIKDWEIRLHDSSEEACQKAAIWLGKNPDVETLVQKDYRVVKFPIVDIRAMGFEHFEGPEPDGHINILGSAEDFKAHQLSFVELIDTGQARILTVEECLENKRL